LCDINPLYLDRKIKFENKSSIREKINELNACAEAAVIITNDKTVNKLDEIKSGDRYGKDEAIKVEDSSETEMLIRELCLVNENECFSNGTENAAKNIIDALKIEDESKKIKMKIILTMRKTLIFMCGQ
jgi:hypothetical protein